MVEDYSEIVAELRGENEELREENAHLKKELEKRDLMIKKLYGEVDELEGKIGELKEDNQKLREDLYGFKSRRRKKRSNSSDCTNLKPKKRGPPFGHKGKSRRKPERVDKTVVLRFDACPTC